MKIKSLFIICFFVLFVCFLSAKNINFNNVNTIDSLKNIIVESKNEEQAKKYYTYAKLLYSKNDSVSKLFAENASYHPSKTDSLEVDALMILGKLYRKESDYENAAKMYQSAIEISSKNNFTVRLLKSYSNYGNLERSTGNFEACLKLFNKADSLLSFITNTNLKAAIYNNIGIVYTSNNDFEKGLTFYRKILKLNNIEEKYKSAAYTNMSGIFTELKQYDSTIIFGLKAIELKEKNKSKGLAEAYNNLGTAYLERGKLSIAKNWLNKSLNKYNKKKNISGKIKVFNNLGKIYLLQNEIDSSENYLLNAQTLNIENTYHYEAIHTQKHLYQLYMEKNNWEKAFKHILSYNKLNEVFINKEKVKTITELQTKYETNQIINDKNLAETNQLLAEKKAQRNFSFLIAALALALLIGVISAFLLYRAKQKKQQELLEVQLAERTKQFGLEKEVLVSKLKALRSQMNPHFIFNLLNSIQHLVLKGDVENSYNFINQFAGLVRSTLDYSDKDKIKLSEELEMLQVYLKLEKLRFNDNFEYKIIEQNTDKEVMMPPMLIQPFIENALVHGLLHKEGMRKLVVSIELTDVVVCTIEDNGVGRAKAKEIRERQRGNHKSFSTAAIEKRFAILSDYYKEELGYTYFDLPETSEMSTRVILRIPFDKLN